MKDLIEALERVVMEHEQWCGPYEGAIAQAKQVLEKYKPKKIRFPVDDAKIGDTFGQLYCTGNLSRMEIYQNHKSDILSIWICGKTGDKYAKYDMAGLQPITETLYNQQLIHFFANGNII